MVRSDSQNSQKLTLHIWSSPDLQSPQTCHTPQGSLIPIGRMTSNEFHMTLAKIDKNCQNSKIGIGINWQKLKIWQKLINRIDCAL